MLHTVAFDNSLDGSEVALMKAVRNSLMWFAGIVFMAGIAQAQDKSELFHQRVASQATPSVTLEMKTEPTVRWGPRMQVSGLFVDLIRPQQTWAMLNPSVPARSQQTLRQSNLPAVKLLTDMNDDLAVHEPDFTLLRLNF